MYREYTKHNTDITKDDFYFMENLIYDIILDSIENETNTLYSGYIAFDNLESVDYIDTGMFIGITDGSRYAVLRP